MPKANTAVQARVLTDIPNIGASMAQDAVHAFMRGGPRQPWWDFTAQRKALLKTQK